MTLYCKKYFHFDENFFRNTKAEVRYSVVNWDLLFDNIYSGKTEIDGIKHVELDITLGFIRGIASYEKLLRICFLKYYQGKLYQEIMFYFHHKKHFLKIQLHHQDSFQYILQ